MARDVKNDGPPRPGPRVPIDRPMVLLFLVMVLAPFVFFSAGAFGPRLITDLGVTTSGVGLLSASGLVGAIIGSLAAGRIHRHLTARGALGLVVGLAALAMVVMGSAWGFGQVLVAALCGGTAMGLATPFTNRAASGLRRLRKDRLVAVAQSGVQVGALLAGALAASAAIWGWRVAILIMLLPCVVTAMLLRQPILGPTADGDQVPMSGAPTRITLPVLPLALFAVTMSAPGGVVISYVATFASEVVGLSASSAGWTTAVFGVTALLSRLVASAMLESATALTPLLAANVIVAAASSVSLFYAPEYRWSLWLGVGLFGASGLLWQSILFVGVVRRTTPREAARVSGFVAASNYAGLLAGPLAAAVLLSRGVAFTTLWIGASLAFLLAAGPVVAVHRRADGLRALASSASPDRGRPDRRDNRRGGTTGPAG